MKALDNFDGYIILLCKNHYKTNDFLTAIKKLWAIRCGYDYDQTDSNTLEYIANQMYRIVRDYGKKRDDDIIYDLHRFSHKPDFQYRDLEPIEAIVMYYRSQIQMMQVKEKRGDKYYNLIKLPKPRKRILNKVFNSDDYSTSKMYNELAYD